ncbi:MAG: hypothetical protein KGR26_13010 [Cyanobacteria bacterium REEB65]|nr:hypothetical protein [Cyanobacteria bacterium REEB65]
MLLNALATTRGHLTLLSPACELLHLTHMRELPQTDPPLTAIDWFGVDSRCRPWVYETLERGTKLLCAGWDLGFDRP